MCVFSVANDESNKYFHQFIQICAVHMAAVQMR